eukprot:4969949-Alexandrium_andersonii.AAC.1
MQSPAVPTTATGTLAPEEMSWQRVTQTGPRNRKPASHNARNRKTNDTALHDPKRERTPPRPCQDTRRSRKSTNDTSVSERDGH